MKIKKNSIIIIAAASVLAFLLAAGILAYRAVNKPEAAETPPAETVKEGAEEPDDKSDAASGFNDVKGQYVSRIDWTNCGEALETPSLLVLEDLGVGRGRLIVSAPGYKSLSTIMPETAYISEFNGVLLWAGYRYILAGDEKAKFILYFVSFKIGRADVYVGYGGEEVVGRAYGVKIAGKMEVNVFHGDDLRPSAAGRSALYTENRSQGRFPQGYHNFLSDFGKPVRNADRCRGFTLARRSWGDSCH